MRAIRRLADLLSHPAGVTAPQAEQAISDGAVLLDVRETGEWRAGHAPQARHLVLSQLEDHLADLPTDRPIVTVCRSGRRSAMAAALLNRTGRHAVNLTGGMTAWAAAGLPVVNHRNERGEII